MLFLVVVSEKKERLDVVGWGFALSDHVMLECKVCWLGMFVLEGFEYVEFALVVYWFGFLCEECEYGMYDLEIFELGGSDFEGNGSGCKTAVVWVVGFGWKIDFGWIVGFE